jgi:hypothetical protein
MTSISSTHFSIFQYLIALIHAQLVAIIPPIWADACDHNWTGKYKSYLSNISFNSSVVNHGSTVMLEAFCSKILFKADKSITIVFLLGKQFPTKLVPHALQTIFLFSFTAFSTISITSFLFLGKNTSVFSLFSKCEASVL